MTAAIGDVLAGKYRVDKILGIGGMGMVVAATHLELDQKVALKFMLPEALLSPQATDRFLREARAAVKLRGEHVCRVLDVGKLDNGAPYIVMEFLEGEDFAHVLARRGALPVAEATDYILQALEGLAEAHVNGIVHRDLKPGNLFVATDNDGSPLVKVLDFGISKSAGANATKTGEVMGSPAYMAPEQMVSAKDVDNRADLWAMGVIVYHAIAGRVPFEEDNLPALCMAVMQATPKPVDAIAPNPVPPAFAAVVMRCLSKNRDERPGDVGELAAALAPFGSSEAQASASRIAKVLRRTGSASSSNAAIAMTLPSSSSDLAEMIKHRTPPNAERHPISTIGASAGESLRQLPAVEPPKPKPLWPKLAAFGTVAAVAVLVIVMVTRGDAKTEPPKEPAPATQPPPPPVSPEPTVRTVPAVTETKPPPVEPETKPEPKPEIKVVAKPTVKPTTKPAIVVKPGSGSAVTAAVVAEPPKPPVETGSAAKPSAGSGYQGIEGGIIRRKKPEPAPESK